MPRKRPTEASWDSDDDLLNDDVGITSTTYSTKRSDFDPEEVDEEALLAGSDDEIQVVAEDEIEQTEEVVEEVYVEEVEEVPGEVEEVQEQIFEEELPVAEAYGAEQSTLHDGVIEAAQEEPLPREQEDDESDSGSDGESGRRRRARFQSERQRDSFEKRQSSSSLSTTTKKEIPDTLPEISAEDQAKIDRYLTKGGGRGRGRRQAWNVRGGHQQYRPRVHQPVLAHVPAVQHDQNIRHNVPVLHTPPMQPAYTQQPPQVQAVHGQPVVYESHQQPVPRVAAPQPVQTTKIHINPHFKPRPETPRPAWETLPRSQPSPVYVPQSHPQPAVQPYPPMSEPVHRPPYSQAWAPVRHEQPPPRPQFTVSQAPPVSYAPAPAPQPYHPPPVHHAQPPYQPPPPLPAPQHHGYQVPLHQPPAPPPGHEIHRPPGPAPLQTHYHAHHPPPPPRQEPPRFAPPNSQGMVYHPQPPLHVRVESPRPPIHISQPPRPQVVPVQARPQVAQVRPRQLVTPSSQAPTQTHLSKASTYLHVQPNPQAQGSQTIQTVIGRKTKPGFHQQQPSQQSRQLFVNQNRQTIEVSSPRKRISSAASPNVEVIAPKLAKIEKELPQNNIKIQTVEMEPIDEEYKRKLEEQKRLREEVKRKKEERRLMMSSLRKEQVQKTLAEQGIQAVGSTSTPPAAAAESQAVTVVQRRPVVQKLKDNTRQQKQTVTMVPIQGSPQPSGIPNTAPLQPVQRPPGPGRHLLMRSVYKVITLKDGRQIKQLVSKAKPEGVVAPPTHQVVKVVRQNVHRQRLPDPQQWMPPPGPPRPGFRPGSFQGPRIHKQFQDQGPFGPGPRFRGPGPMGPRLRGPGPPMMRLHGPPRPHMGMRGPPPRPAVRPAPQRPMGFAGRGRILQNKKLVTGVKRTVKTSTADGAADQGATPAKRVVVDTSPVKKTVGDGVSKSVSIENLSSSTSLPGIKKLCVSVGPLESIKLDAQEKKAIAKFSNPDHAALFVEKYNRHMVDLSHINLSLIV